MRLTDQIIEGLGPVFACENLITHCRNLNGSASLCHAKTLKRYIVTKGLLNSAMLLSIRRSALNAFKKREPRRFPGGVLYSQPNYSVISMQQPLCGQHAPPPQQLSLLEPTGVAAVRPTSAARMSKYFITPPVELRCISAANIAPSHCGGESGARRRAGRSISPIETVAIARENCVGVELRNGVLIRNTAHQHERGTRCWAAVRRL